MTFVATIIIIVIIESQDKAKRKQSRC